MLCPEISDFPPPKVYMFQKQCGDIKTVDQFIEMNHFYKSVIITCPDENDIDLLQNAITEDTIYYKISNCPMTEFVNYNFIDYYIKHGKINCLSAERNCVVQNCAAITPDGILTIHILEFVYQTLGFEGTKRPHGYYEVKIDLNTVKNLAKVRNALAKLQNSDFYITWEPKEYTMCPSSIAKYFYDRKIQVSEHKITFEKITPDVNHIPTLVDTDVEEIVEWIGLLAHEGDVSPTEGYISTYSEPDCEAPIKSTRMSILIAKGFIKPDVLTKLTELLKEYVMSRFIENYWVAISIQGIEDSLWQFSASSPKMFQSHNSSNFPTTNKIEYVNENKLNQSLEYYDSVNNLEFKINNATSRPCYGCSR